MVYLHFFYDPDTIHTLLLPVTIISAKWRMYAQRKRYRNLRWAGELVWGVSSCQQTDAHTHNSLPFPPSLHPFPNPLHPLSHLTSPSFPPLLHFLPCPYSILFPAHTAPSSPHPLTPPPFPHPLTPPSSLLPFLPFPATLFATHWKRLTVQRYVRRYKAAVIVVRRFGPPLLSQG